MTLLWHISLKNPKKRRPCCTIHLIQYHRNSQYSNVHGNNPSRLQSWWAKFLFFFFNNEEWAELLSGSADYIIEGLKNQARVGPPGLRNLLGH
jgi:hypothetical protein